MPERPTEGGDDRFGDLGGGTPPRSAAERLAERDALDEEERRQEQPPGPPKPSSRYAWFIGFVFVIVAAAALANQIVNLRDDAGGALKGPEPGTRLPEFAAPLVTSDVEGDVNVRQKASGDDSAGPVPACEVRTEGVLNSCELRKQPLVLTFIFDRAADCEPQVDRVERMKGEFPRVAFATVYFSRKERDELEAIVRRRNWTQPVAVDQDGALSNVLGVGGCPITVFVRPGGKVMKSETGPLTEDELRAGVRALLAPSRGRAPRAGS